MGETEQEGYGETLDLLCSFSVPLWALAVVSYGFGDLLTTVVGLGTDGVAEAGILAALVSVYGVAGLVALKVASFLVFGAVWAVVPDPYRIGVPLGVAALGTVVTVWNLVVLAVQYA